MDESFLYRLSPLSDLIILGIALISGALIGYLLGRWKSRQKPELSQIGTIQASILGLLALLLGFTFGVASSRYEVRRGLAVDEANALGTTFLRAQMLPEPYRTNLSQMLRRYIDLRVDMKTAIHDADSADRLMQRTTALQQAIWKQATELARGEPRSIITGLFVSSLNDSIDLFAARVAAFRTRVPSLVLSILIITAIVALGIVGFGFGLTEQRSWIIMGLTAMVVALVIVMIVDMDRPARGPIRVYQQNMIDLRNSLSGFEVGAGR